jgi:hypothetical protein
MVAVHEEFKETGEEYLQLNSPSYFESNKA